MTEYEQAHLLVVHTLAGLLADTNTMIEAKVVIAALDRECASQNVQRKIAPDGGTSKAKNGEKNTLSAEYTKFKELSTVWPYWSTVTCPYGHGRICGYDRGKILVNVDGHYDVWCMPENLEMICRADPECGF